MAFFIYLFGKFVGQKITLGCNIEKHHYYVEWKLAAINLLTCYNMEKKNLKNKNKIKLATIE